MHLNFITLNTGALSRAERSQIKDEALGIVATWLQNAVGGARTPLPGAYADCDAVVYMENGGLVVTVFNGPDPLVTFGVAQRSLHGQSLWSLLLANFAHEPSIERPREPWLAVAVHNTLFKHLSATDWLADFEQCVAWAWITRNVQIETV
jgi:hypothetical protein